MTNGTSTGRKPGEPGENPANPDKAGSGRTWSAEHGYAVLCLVALAVMFTTLASRLGFLALFPLLLGAATVLLRWAPGLALTLLSIAVLLIAERIQSRQVMPASLSALDFGLCASILALTLGHYRLQALRTFQQETREQRRQRRRSPELAPKVVTPGSITDIGPALLTVLLCAGWALAGGLWLLELRPRLGLRAELWNTIEVVWFLGLTLMFCRGLLRLLQRRSMSAEEAMMVLQDTLWQQTRKEQRRINSWLAWTRSRRRKGER